MGVACRWAFPLSGAASTNASRSAIARYRFMVRELQFFVRGVAIVHASLW